MKRSTNIDALLDIARNKKIPLAGRESVVEELKNLGQVNALSTLVHDKGVSGAIRVAAAEALGRLGRADEALDVLLELVRNTRVAKKVREDAIEALIRLGREDEAISALLALAYNEGVSGKIRVAAAEALARLRRADEALDVLLCPVMTMSMTMSGKTMSVIVDKAMENAIRIVCWKYLISIAHPKLLSKGYSALFVVGIYPPSIREEAIRKMGEAFGMLQKKVEHVGEIELEQGLRVRIKLSSPVLLFSEPVIKKIENNLTISHFTAIPTENCRPGVHDVVCSIVDAETQVEYLSRPFRVQVVDFAFDHISRPFLSKVSSAVLGLGSLTMFVLTAIEQIDKAFGLTAGTTAALLTSVILIRLWSLFQRPRITHMSE